ncbi:MAG TPA: VacJ family lipoprotein [Geomonas sp.]|nr:VacJ family lipoprotein [Geomonas sp.]
MPSTLRRIICALSLLLMAAGCATTTGTLPEQPPMHTVSEVEADARLEVAPERWERFNRSMYNFNYRLDRYLLLPIVRGYEFVTPGFAQKGVSNFFSNIEEVRNLTNSMFQLKGMESLTTLGRFVTNSTIGIGGLFDVATPLGMPSRREDFGQTLGYWGVGPGPYLVMPFLGPSSLRDTSGFVADAAIRSAIIAGTGLDNSDNWDTIATVVVAMEAIDKRHLESFRYWGTGSPFEYDMVRYLYTKKREFDTAK